MIHYCYGDERWTKRDYFRDDEVRQLWHPSVQAPAGSILDELLKQIREAGQFYHDPLSAAAALAH
jgi:FAD/FMN-containing dehydrogenase